jgi:iron complex outermembrane receptor protein
MDKWVVELALRYDDTAISSGNPAQQDNDYSEPTGYLLATYNADEHIKYFAGFGRSSRVPDAKELYWIGSMGNPIGTPNLENTINNEIDVGTEWSYENTTFKAKAFYSMLGNFIAYNASNTKKVEMVGKLVPIAWNAYENVDATIYGIELSGTYIATDSIYFDYGLTYQRGEKDHPLTGQVGTNMPEIPPLKLVAAVNYDYDATLNLRAEVVAAASWDEYDYENGEQELPSYAILNLKGSKTFMDSVELVFGVDNVLDKTYAISNTYKDLILLTVPGNEVMLLNEPGRYFYANLKYSF